VPPERADGQEVLTVQDDIDLFVHQSCWVYSQLERPGLDSMVEWVSGQMHEEARIRRSLLLRLEVDEPARIRGERALCVALAEAPVRNKVQWHRTSIPERDVDWPRTAEESAALPPSEFWSRRVAKVLDRELLAALCTVARRWRDQLVLVHAGHHHAFRVHSLESALAVVPRGAEHSASLDRWSLARLRQSELLSAAQFEDLVRALGRFDRAVPVAQIEAIFREVLLKEAHEQCWRSLDNLLEISARMSVARAAHSRGWRLHPVLGDTGGAGTLLLHRGPLRLEVSKRAPGLDRFVEVRERSGLARHRRAYSGQPDCVLRFWHVDTPQYPLVVLGDAKRNREMTGLLRDGLRTAVYYQAAFSRQLGIRLEDGRFEGGLRPHCTLFYRRGPSPPDETLETFRCGQFAEIPEIIAMNLEDDFGVTDEGQFRSEVLDLWVGALEAQVELVLGASKEVSSAAG